jgi:hypothetical protein
VTITAIEPGDQVHTVWDEAVSGSDDIFYKRDGADFDPSTINFSDDVGTSQNVAIAVVGNDVHIVWEDESTGEILYRRSVDSGASFGPFDVISSNIGDSNNPAIAAFGNSVHVAWHGQSGDDFDILYRRSTDGGATFTEPVKNLSNNVGDSTFPAIAASGNIVHVVWQDNTLGEPDILYRRSLNDGMTFPNIITNLSDDAGFSVDPAIAVSGNSVHVVWTNETPGNPDVLYIRSLDN